MMFWLSALLLATAILFGGGTRAGFLGDVLVQFLAVPLLLASAWRWAEDNRRLSLRRRSPEFPLLVAALMAFAMLVLQLLPLPGHLWADRLAATPIQPYPLGAGAGGEAWRGLSLTPAASWAAAVSTLPPLALFLGIGQLDIRSRFRLAAVVIGLGALGLLIGFLQVAQGPHSSLRFFQITNPSEAVGFFANRNHFAALLYTTLVFGAVWFAFAARNLLRIAGLETHAALWFAAASALLVAVIAGLALTRSRAGIFLAFAAVAGIVAMVFGDRRAPEQGRNLGERSVQRLALAALVFAILFAAQFGLHRVMTRFETDPLDDLRVALTPVTLRMAWDSLPFGTGLGSFVPVYATAEKTTDLFAGYANRAHNDWAEFLLEGGIFAASIMLLFLWWFGGRVVAVWQRVAPERPCQHLMLQRGATIVIGLLLAHSFVDYPLRTTAMAAIFAFACAVLVAPPEPETPLETPAPRPIRRRSEPRRANVPQGQWGGGIEWPEAWKRP